MGKIINSGGVPSGTTLKTSFEVDYYSSTAPITQPVDTGVTLVDMLTHQAVSVSLVTKITGTGSRYSLDKTINTALIGNPAFLDLRFSRTSEFEDATGDVSMSFWVSSTTSTLWYEYDYDIPSGKEFESISVIGYTYYV